MIIFLKYKPLFLISTFFLVIFLSGCASIENYQPLEKLQISYDQLQKNPDVNNYAAAQLYDAGQSVSKAEDAANKGDQKLLDHYVYLGERHLKIAEEVAGRKKNQAYIEELSEQRSNLLIESRTKEAQKARDELEAYKTKNSKRGTVLVLDDLHFDTGGATLHRGSQRNLDPLVRYMNDHPEREIAIEGHTDNVGEESLNIDLSFRRAEAVKNYLVTSGISRDRISTKGFGESMPVASNNTAQGRQLNRRVEIVVLD